VQIYEVSPRILHMDTTFDDSFGAMLGTSTGRLHAKMMVVDDMTTVVGSMNLDFRSSRANTELGLFGALASRSGRTEIHRLARRRRLVKRRGSPVTGSVKAISRASSCSGFDQSGSAPVGGSGHSVG